jgi:hypothetical protein
LRRKDYYILKAVEKKQASIKKEDKICAVIAAPVQFTRGA